MMKKICSWLLVMALFAAALVGCGPREAQGDETIKDTREGRNQYPGGCPDCRFERTHGNGNGQTYG